MAPSFDIPVSSDVVRVKIIDSTTRMRIPLSMIVSDPIPGHDFLDCPAYSFLIEHASGQMLPFDLGLRKDIQSFSPAVQASFLTMAQAPGASVSVEKNVAEVLKDEGSVDLKDINAIIWSHWHPDHSGDPSTFPASTSLLVSHGVKDSFLPGYPANPQSPILETDYQDRDFEEINLGTPPAATKIGGFRAVDYFHEGSFYLLDSPGHTVGHMVALARTTPSTFALLGADTCHHASYIRPSHHQPFPDSLSPSPLSNPPFLPGSICPGEVLVNMHPGHIQDKPFYHSLSEAPDRNLAEAEDSISKLIDFDERGDVFVIIAHDSSLLDVVDFFPKAINGWKEKGWKEETKWRFLRDLPSTD